MGAKKSNSSIVPVCMRLKPGLSKSWKFSHAEPIHYQCHNKTYFRRCLLGGSFGQYYGCS